MFCGFRSQWIRPWAWMLSSACSNWTVTPGSFSLKPFAKNRLMGTPSMNSMVKYGLCSGVDP